MCGHKRTFTLYKSQHFRL